MTKQAPTSIKVTKKWGEGTVAGLEGDAAPPAPGVAAGAGGKGGDVRNTPLLIQLMLNSGAGKVEEIDDETSADNM